MLTAKSALGVGSGVGVTVGFGVTPGLGVTVGVGVGFGTPLTVVVVIDELFPGTGSVEVDETDALFVITVPFGVLPLTLTDNVSKTVPLIKLGVVQLMLPVPPTAGVVQENVNLLVCVSETNVVFAGTCVVNVTPIAESGPAFVIAIG